MIAWIVEINRGPLAARADFISRPGVTAHVMKRVAERNIKLLDARKGFVKSLSRHRKSVMLVPLCAPRRNLQREIVVDSDDREGPIFALQLKAQNIHVKIDARGHVINVENQMIDRRHRAFSDYRSEERRVGKE